MTACMYKNEYEEISILPGFETRER